MRPRVAVAAVLLIVASPAVEAATRTIFVTAVSGNAFESESAATGFSAVP